MRRTFRVFPLAILMVCLVLGPGAPPATAQAHVPLPFEETGSINGAPYKIRVPVNWNGALLVFAHGYRDRANHAGEVDDRSAPAAPGGTAFEDALLAQGYALAGSAFRANGFAVKEGIQNTLALTNLFRGRVGNPQRTILWGASMGSIVTLAGIERYPGIYQGAIPFCTVGAGTPVTADFFLAFQIAYDVAFGFPAAWGQLGMVRDDIDFETEVFPVLLGQVTNPVNFGRFEFIRLVSGLNVAPIDFLSNWVFTDMFFVTEAAAELQLRARGNVAQNLNHTYSLTAAQKAYLAALGINADALLAAMNARRIPADPNARNYARQYSEYTGKIKRPVLSLHTQVDGFIAPFHQTAYRNTVLQAGNGQLLLQLFTNGVGHCAFTGPQLFVAVQAMDAWIQTGVQPPAAAFPAALGFLAGFDPGPFPHVQP